MNQNDFGAGTCIAYAADGAVCGAWEGPPCPPPAKCVASDCVLPGGDCAGD